MHRRLAAFAEQVVRHRPVGEVGEAGAVEAGEQEAGVAVAEPGLAARERAEPLDRGLGDPARAVAAAREPDRVEGRIVRGLHQRLEPGPVLAGEMAVAKEALRVEMELGAGRLLRRQRGHLLRRLLEDRRARSDDGDPQGPSPLQPVADLNRAAPCRLPNISSAGSAAAECCPSPASSALPAPRWRARTGRSTRAGSRRSSPSSSARASACFRRTAAASSPQIRCWSPRPRSRIASPTSPLPIGSAPSGSPAPSFSRACSIKRRCRSGSPARRASRR
jgi:hypothetical protein